MASQEHYPTSEPANLEIESTLQVETIKYPLPTISNPNKEDVFLTWKDLWVKVPEGRNGWKFILQGLTGYARPGEMLAVMGPSGCGKSTLIDALAGRLHSNTRQVGEILINSHSQKLALTYGTSAYVTQDDTLIATLTVRETVYYSALLQLPDSMSNSDKKERAETTIREMGLQVSMDTRVGGWGVKGLSGGQKRRLNICVNMLTHPKLLFLDEPTSGLDSAASYYVMRKIASLGHSDYGSRRTIIVSIHQPSSEVFMLFHNLCLLSSGRTIYFGPASAANEFFASNGFPCPTLQNPSDHFLKTINMDFDKDLEQGMGDSSSVEEAIDTLVNSYKSSEIYQQIQENISEIHKQDYGELEKKRSHAGFFTQCRVLTNRSFVNMNRDPGYYWLRFVIYIGLDIGLGTVFYNLGSSYGSIQARGSFLMFTSSFLTFMAIGGFPSFVEDMKVFQQERLNGHYGVTAFVVGNTISSLPYLIIISAIPGAIGYFLAGLHKGFEHFLYFTLVMYASMILVESLMMVVASIVGNFLMGIITGAGIQGLMILTGGFFRLPNDLPKPVWKYPLFYISFHKYAYQGLFKNEFEGLKFSGNNQAAGEDTIKGEAVLRDTWQVEMDYSKWVDLVILMGMIVVYRLLFLVIIKAGEKVKRGISNLMLVHDHEEMRQVVVIT